jgi:hypothetical protein
MVSLASVIVSALLLQTTQRPLPPPPAPSSPSIAGVWSLNKDLSDAGRSGGDQGDDRPSGRRGGGGGYGGGGGGRRGGYGGGMGRGGGGGGGGQTARNPDEVARMRDAMRDVIDPSERLTIVQTDSMILITGADGRTTRLSADGKKIKDDNTGIERKTKWDAGKLVSEISGLGNGKLTQTFSVDPEAHQLRIVVQMDGGRSGPRTVTHVYDRGE